MAVDEGGHIFGDPLEEVRVDGRATLAEVAVEGVAVGHLGREGVEVHEPVPVATHRPWEVQHRLQLFLKNVVGSEDA